VRDRSWAEGSVVPASDRELLTALAEAIGQRVGAARYQLWFRDRTRLRWEEDQLVVGVPNHFYQEWMQKTFGEAVQAAAAEVYGTPVAVRFVIDPELFRAARQAEEAVRAAPTVRAASPLLEPPQAPPTPPVAGSCRPAIQRTSPRRWRRLEDFVVGASNRLAHAAALRVVEAPGQEVNPLVFYGPPGTGKTHLLEGIYVALRRQAPAWRLCFLTAEEFTHRFIQALRLERLSGFRKFLRSCDALLLDDVHFLDRKKATQEELLHTLDALNAAGRQVVLTCAGHPRLHEHFLPELLDRLLGGAIWGLGLPDRELRVHLLERQAQAVGLGLLPAEVRELLADQLRGNVRELEGALHSLRHYQRVTGRTLDLALAREVLGEVLRHQVRQLHLEDIDQAVCRVLQLPSGALQSPRRDERHSRPRMLAMYLARKYTPATYEEIGRYFGKRRHSTALAAEKKVRSWLAHDGLLSLGEQQVRVRELIERLENELFH
jgi:chromosomal replication initiator protein